MAPGNYAVTGSDDKNVPVGDSIPAVSATRSGPQSSFQVRALQTLAGLFPHRSPSGSHHSAPGQSPNPGPKRRTARKRRRFSRSGAMSKGRRSYLTSVTPHVGPVDARYLGELMEFREYRVAHGYASQLSVMDHRPMRSTSLPYHLVDDQTRP